MFDIELKKAVKNNYKVLVDGKKVGSIHVNDENEMIYNDFKQGDYLTADFITKVIGKVKEDKKNNPDMGFAAKATSILLAHLLVIGLLIYGIKSCSESSEAWKKSPEYKEKKRRGLHCANGTDDRFRVVDVEWVVKQRLRDPDSFGRIKTTIEPVKDGKNTGILVYRAKNGFGGMSIGKVAFVLSNESCKVISVENIE